MKNCKTQRKRDHWIYSSSVEILGWHLLSYNNISMFLAHHLHYKVCCCVYWQLFAQTLIFLVIPDDKQLLSACLNLDYFPFFPSLAGPPQSAACLLLISTRGQHFYPFSLKLKQANPSLFPLCVFPCLAVLQTFHPSRPHSE